MKIKILSFLIATFTAFTALSACSSEDKKNDDTKSSAEEINSSIGDNSDATSSDTSDDGKPKRFENMADVVKSANFPNIEEVGFEKYENPFTSAAADPFITVHEGKYYYCFSTGTGIYVTTFDDLRDATSHNRVCIFDPPKGETEYGKEIWAPEMHFIDGHWYVYFAASDGKNENHRMFVLKSKTSDAMGEYEFAGKITDSTDKWAIDGTVFTYKNEMYYVWSGWEKDVNVAQYLYIAKMSSPTTLSSERICISKPEKGWEILGGSPLVNEGPIAISSGDYLTILYSASGSWSDEYCIGQLLFKGGDVLDPESWEKQAQPVLKKDPERFYGPGHCSIVPDGNGVLWMAFHANKESGTGWNGRSGWLLPITVNEQGGVEVIFY